MRTYLRLFFNLLMPISMIITIVAIAYFSVSYDFTKAMKLGVLSGVLLGFGFSLVAALFLLVTRSVKKPVQGSLSIHEEPKNNNRNIPIKETPVVNMQNAIEQKLMLLMDKKLAFEVALYAIIDQNIGEIKTHETKDDSIISVHTQDGKIQISSTPLTRHTSQVILKTERNSPYLNKIISYIKEKEHSFLQY
ncbi:MAG: hypothetical protein KJO45_00880 [Sulfurovum sp.]|nr:hypothetical protein [Sulfurovum sp.]